MMQVKRRMKNPCSSKTEGRDFAYADGECTEREKQNKKKWQHRNEGDWI